MTRRLKQAFIEASKLPEEGQDAIAEILLAEVTSEQQWTGLFDAKTTKANISHQYTALNQGQNLFIINELDKSFEESMNWWEKAINHYLATGKMLLNN